MPYFTQTQTGSSAPAPTLAEKTRRAYVALRRSMISGPRAPFMGKHGKRRAAYALERARHEAAKGVGPKHNAPEIWKGLGRSDGEPFAACGEAACRWIENPESKGLRLVGFAHEVGSTYERQVVDHSGWYIDSHQHETVKGIVYRLPARGGKCRFVAGYSGPHNGDEHGNGPALVSLEIYESDATGAHYETPDAAFDTARAADIIAERVAEQERNYREAYSNGTHARSLMRAATLAASKHVKTIRAFRDVWENRHALHTATVRQFAPRVTNFKKPAPARIHTLKNISPPNRNRIFNPTMHGNWKARRLRLVRDTQARFNRTMRQHLNTLEGVKL